MSLKWVIWLLACGVMPASSQHFEVRRELVIDAEANDLSSVGFVDAFANGGIIVAQPQDHRLLLFSEAGHLLKALGRQGAGPGEFGQLAWVHGFIGDTLWVYDGSLYRYSLVDPAGQIVADMRITSALTLPQGAELPGSSTPSPYGVLKGRGFRVGTPLLDAARLPVAWRSRIGENQRVVLDVSDNGVVRGVVTGVPDDAQVCGREPQLQSECPRPMFATGIDATPFVAVTTTISDAGATLHVLGLGEHGNTLFDRILPFKAMRIPETVKDSIRKMWIEGAANEGVRQQRRRAEYPQYYRPVRRLLVAHDGSVWIALRQQQRVLDWLILNPDGSTRGWLALPLATTVEAVRWPLVWGTERTESGLENVVRYRLTQPRPRPATPPPPPSARTPDPAPASCRGAAR